MKIFKTFIVAFCFINASLCMATGTITGSVTTLKLFAPSTSSTTPNAMVILSGSQNAPSSDIGCYIYTGWVLPDLTDQFQKLAYATLLAAQINGRTLYITYTNNSSGGCIITQINQVQ